MPISVVGIGASAGGVQVLQQLFAEMPTRTGLAFVVVMHLSPDHVSNLAEILQARTEMQVIQVTKTVKVERDRVYVIPPSKHLSMNDGMLVLSRPQQETGRRVTIDLFFRTLAQQYGQRAVCVILSGTDSDGVIGLKHIKAQGGVTITQDPAEAEFDSMPRHAIETGMVDWVLPASAIPMRLVDYVQNEKAITLPPEKNGEEESALPDLAESSGGGPLLAKETSAPDDEKAISQVLVFLRSQTGHDFFHYKRATVLRRIARRLQVNSLKTLPRYLEFLQTHPGEARALLSDLLINVTHFFRDPTVFGALQANIPQLFAGKGPDDQLRVWVPGCATGEEAYSIAILLWEAAVRLERPPAIQIFATDLDDEAVRSAREGIYPTTIEADVSPERLRRFFFEFHGRHRIRKEVRELLLFAPHDLLRDSPFSRLDLISCRNLLIYLKPEAQHRALDIFHFGLRPGGLLVLGNAESVDGDHVLFAPLDKQNRIYVRRNVARWPMVQLLKGARQDRRQDGIAAPRLAVLPEVTELAPPESAQPQLSATQQRLQSLSEIHVRLIEKHGPASVLVNEAYDIIHLSARAASLLRFTTGEPSTNLLQLVDESLRLELRTALFRAAQSGEPVAVSGIQSERDGALHLVDFRVWPLAGANDETLTFMLMLEDRPATEEGKVEGSRPQSHEPVTRHLEEELRQTRGRLNSTVEHYETSNEELKAANEELQAMNEEMRSASEELETSKEELQSVNEELTTLNQELKSNIEELNHTNSDLQNLIASTDIATIFLDTDLRIKRYTPLSRELFNLRPADLDRPLSDITTKLEYTALIDDATRVLRTLEKTEREVPGAGDNTYLARLSPYRTVDDRINGLVVSFVNTTAIKQAEIALAKSEEEFRRGIEEAPIPMIMQAEDGQVLQISRSWTALTGYTTEDIPTFDAWLNKAYGFGGEDLRARVRQSFHGETPLEQVEFDIITRDGERRTWSFSASPIGALRDGRRFIIGMALDITDSKRSGEDLRRSEEKYRTLFDSMDEGFCIIEVLFDKKSRPVDYRFVDVNPAFARQTGIKNGTGKRMREIAPEHESHWFDIYGRIALTGQPYRFQERAEQLHRFYDVYAFRVGEPEERKVAIFFNDITKRKRSEEELLTTRNQLAAELSALARLHDLNTRMLASEKIEPFLEEVLESVMELQGAESGSIQLLNQASGALEVIASRGFKQALLDHFAKSPVDASSACGRAWQRRKRVVIEDVTKDSAYRKHRKAAAAAGYRAVVSTPLTDRAGETVGILNIHFANPHCPSERDLRLTDLYASQAAEIVSLKLAGHRLRESEERYRLLVEGTPDYAMFLIDPGNRITYWSAGAEKVFGWKANEAIGQNGRLIFTPEDRTGRQEKRELAVALRDGYAPDRRWHTRKDGRRIWIDGVMRRLDHADGSLRGFAKIARDATDLHTAEDELTRARDELEQRVIDRTKDLTATNTELEQTIAQRQQLERELLEISEREKRRIGEDLHDMVCQDLTATALFLKSSAKQLAEESPRASQTLEESAETVNRNVGAARELARGLQAMELTAGGFTNALRTLVDHASENSQIRCHFKAVRGIRVSDESIALHVYRIVQEAITNAIKHSEAKNVFVSLDRSPTSVSVKIRDDGKGFLERRRRKGLGLHMMRYRANALGGELKIGRGTKGGTEITCVIPNPSARQ